jgi:pimeloyl-ACP methyl ester carboxylesterase
VLHSPRLLIAGLVFLAACSNPVDRAAKERIFSPEDPPAVVASAKESLDAQKLASDAKLAHRVVDMGSAEVTERLGPHRFSAEVSFTWTAGKDSVKLNETRLLESAAGGVAGDFHARLDNSRDQGLEVVRSRGQVFARSKYGKYRLRLRDRGMAERTRDETAGALRELAGLFQGRLQLALEGPTSVEGRPAIRYTVQLADASASGKVVRGETPPAVAYARGGLDDDTARRQRFIEHREPKKLSGEVVVDAATAVILRAHVDGTLAVSGDKTVAPAQLHVLLDERIKDVGKTIDIKPPEGHLPDADKPEGIADALDRFGIQRKGAPDAGVDTETDEDTSG